MKSIVRINTDLFSLHIKDQDGRIRVARRDYRRDGSKDRWRWIENQDAEVDAARLVGVVEKLATYEG